MKIDKKTILKILVKIEAFFLKIWNFFKKGIILLANFILLFSLCLSLLDYLFYREKQINIFIGILGILGWGVGYVISIIPVTSFLNYRLDKIINKIQNLDSRVRKINKKVFFFIKTLFVTPIFLMNSICLKIYEFKLFYYLKDELGIKVRKAMLIELILEAYIFSLIYVLLLTYFFEKILNFYYKKKSIKQ